MSSKSRKKPTTLPGEWLFLSLMASISVGAIMWNRHGAAWGILEFLLTMVVFLIWYYYKYRK